MDSNKLYVGGLPYSTTEADLKELFSEHGTVESARVITDRQTGPGDHRPADRPLERVRFR